MFTLLLIIKIINNLITRKQLLFLNTNEYQKCSAVQIQSDTDNNAYRVLSKFVFNTLNSLFYYMDYTFNYLPYKIKGDAQ